ncbi:MAG: malonyl-CoA decarboxylase family protein [Halioglobus sp.]|nr:malonyl-CoA decarboxylase family protein [Halioglobus sp.]
MPEEQFNAERSTEVAARSYADFPARTLTTLGRTLSSVLVVGRDLLERRRASQPAPLSSVAGLIGLCAELLDHRGEASGLALASEVATAYQTLPVAQRLEFFTALANDFEVDSAAVLAAADQYREDACIENLWAIKNATEAPRQKLFRRINVAPEGTRTLVAMRGHLLDILRTHPQLRGVDSDLKHLFISWFNKGFLELRRIDWSSPASVLEKIIHYEAVHEINGWDDLRSRLRDDRRCFAFFHPALPNDPLVFVEIALTNSIPESLPPLLLPEREGASHERVNTVVFYSISNCHPGLASITFGNFLIKGVVEELKKEIPRLKYFVTLSPVPGFRNWLLDADLEGLVPGHLADRVKVPVGAVVDAQVYDALLKLCAHYLLRVKSGRLPQDPVARFHLGNGAQLHGIHGGADLSSKGRKQSAGIMVNYLYDLPKIEENHEAYFDQGKVAHSKAVSRLLD